MREQQKAMTRRRVINAAAYLFAKQGVSATPTADIARRAKLSHGGLFVHFGSRDELLAEVVATIGMDITDRIHELISSDASLEAVLRSHIECLAKHEASYAAFLMESRLLPKDVLRTWVSVQSAISEHIAVAADRDAAAEKIRDLPPHILYNTWIGLVHHYLMNRALFAPGRSVLQKCGRELVDQYLTLVRRR